MVVGLAVITEQCADGTYSSVIRVSGFLSEHLALKLGLDGGHNIAEELIEIEGKKNVG